MSVIDICRILRESDDENKCKVLLELCKTGWPESEVTYLIDTFCELLENTDPITNTLLSSITLLEWPPFQKDTEKLIDAFVKLFEHDQFKSKIVCTLCVIGWPSTNYPQLNTCFTQLLQTEADGFTILEHLIQNSDTATKRLCQELIRNFGIATGHKVSVVERRLKSQIKKRKYTESSESSKYLDIVEYTKRGMIDQVRYLAPKVNVNERDGWGDCAVIQATVRNDLKILRILVDAGANLKVRNSTAMTPLDYARYHDNREMVQYIMDHL